MKINPIPKIPFPLHIQDNFSKWLKAKKKKKKNPYKNWFLKKNLLP